MANEYAAAPIDHSAKSATAGILGGVGSGLVKTGVKAVLGWTAGLGVLGGALGVGLGLMTGGAAFILAPVLGIAGLLAGGYAGFATSATAGAIGGLYGGFRGGDRAAGRISQERGAASILQAQADIASTQAFAQAQSQQAPSYQYPPQGSPMNAANTNIQVGADVAYDGRVTGQQLAAAR